jgi:mannose-6-phosphate isomerase-like protein (cupin superfamily)
MKLDVAHPGLLRPGEGEVIADRPERTLRILADSDELTLSWFRYARGERGPDPHIHKQHTDAFYVLSGEISVFLGPDAAHEVRATAGAFVAAPAGVVHTFANETSAEATFLNIHAPGMGFGDMLRARRDGRDEEADRFDQFPPPVDGGLPVSEATISLPGDGESVPGEHRDFVVKAEHEELEVIEFACDPEFGPVEPHVHTDKVDSFYILEGEVEFTIGDEIVRAGQASFVAARPGVRHGFRTPGPGRAHFLNVHAPSDGFIERVRRAAQRETEE